MQKASHLSHTFAAKPLDFRAILRIMPCSSSSGRHRRVGLKISLPFFRLLAFLQPKFQELWFDTPAILALADGTIFKGTSIGASGSTTGEVSFNTAMMAIKKF